MAALIVGGKRMKDLVMIDGVSQLSPTKRKDGIETRQQDRVYRANGKSCLVSAGKSNVIKVALSDKPPYRVRHLTPTECARLQTIPDWYRWECSAAQQYKMLGNGWTVEVIKHIFSFLPDEFKTK